MKTEWTAALTLVWHVISAAIFGILLTPIFVSSQTLAGWVPPCESKTRYHVECAFCGMTSAFYEISTGDLSQAESLNRGSVPLYAAFVFNEGSLAVYWMRKKYPKESLLTQ